MVKKIMTCLLFAVFGLQGGAQTVEPDASVRKYFRQYETKGYAPASAIGIDSLRTEISLHEIRIYANEAFCSQSFTPEKVKQIYAELQRVLPAPYNAYRITVVNKKGISIEELVPNILRTDIGDASRLWGDIRYNGTPWVQNMSKPYRITNGLQHRHLFIWASHGRYFAGDVWKWQRPYLFATTEDLLTQSIVYPFLMPMLENAGAIVCSPRERDYQTNEAVVDNDMPQRMGQYVEVSQSGATWTASADSVGFLPPIHLLADSVMPFRSGTYRMVQTTSRRSRLATATWTPNIPQSGRYAVYVSYASRPNSVPDAHYTVFHKGGRTSFTINQQMGGSTWLYLGTFEFEAGSSTQGRVVLTNHSNYRGVVTADGVRFGGGMAQTVREQSGTSGVPRYLEAARYYAQWAGLPDTLFNTSVGMNDYADDLRVRSNMLNYLAGGSVYVPNKPGMRVPFELALALHSDAGFHSDHSIFGSLSICTTQDAEGNAFYGSGLSRRASLDFSSQLINNLTADLSAVFQTQWVRRENWDRNYAETRMPAVPSAILEMFSHQNFTDMKYGHDPVFKFTLARSVYKTILQFVNFEHGIKTYTVQPLPVHHFAAQLSADGKKVRLSWKPRTDALEPTAEPMEYIVYTKTGNDDFDNGTSVGNATACDVTISPNKVYAFKVTAVNAGGESFPSETLSAYYSPTAKKHVLIVNGFNRLSGPAWVETPDSLGFDLQKDMGVPYMSTTAFSGRQRNFIPSAAGLEGEVSLGYSGQELIGKNIAGNTFNYPCAHGLSIAASGGEYSCSSVGSDAFAAPGFSTNNYDVIDYIAGLQVRRPYNFRSYPTFSPQIREKISRYLDNGGALLVSGSFIGSDNAHDQAERQFIEEVLKFKYDGTAKADPSAQVTGLNMRFDIYRQSTPEHYGASSPDALLPASKQAFSAFAYNGGQGAGVAYKGRNYRVISMGFPFECIKDMAVRHTAMKAILHFLTDDAN